MRRIQKVSDIPANETLDFVIEHLPDKKERILEVGCGNGELAFALQNEGFQIVAIDNSAEAVENAEQLGVDARVTDFLSFAESDFGTVLFTRSLHHIHELKEAAEKSRQILKPGGLVIVEDFAFNEADETTIEWLYGVTSILNSAQQLNLAEDNFAKDLLLRNGDYDVWRENHHHDLHSAPTMFAELKKYFVTITEVSAPYLYRYLCLLLNKNPNGVTIASQILEIERRMAKMGSVDLIGRRFVGRKV